MNQEIKSKIKIKQEKIEIEIEPIPHEMIAQRAYEIWLDRDCPDGFEVENWCDAERGLLEERRQLRAADKFL